MSAEWKRDQYTISCDPARLDLTVVHDFLRNSYWAHNISRDVLERSIENSICFGVYHEQDQVGFARVITDRATFAYLADVFIIEEYRGRGLAKWLIESILQHRELSDLRRWILVTRDAHDLYRRCGFKELKKPELFMER